MTDQKERPIKVSRRDFVKGAALGAGLLTGAGTLASCGTAAAPAAPGVPESWDHETDVVIVGYGGAGAAAAIAARDAGAEVIILEKREVPGGTTAICGGVYYAAGTSVQEENGIDDS
ncbi:MAG TPA: FAD-binding protein, partial [Anaerolineae bacterium]|nr:FAD-binding protein [Anaerolineae bacterium]